MTGPDPGRNPAEHIWYQLCALADPALCRQPHGAAEQTDKTTENIQPTDAPSLTVFNSTLKQHNIHSFITGSTLETLEKVSCVSCPSVPVTSAPTSTTCFRLPLFFGSRVFWNVRKWK